MDKAKFPLTDDDMGWVAELVRLTRRMATLPKVTPDQLIGLGRALYALERLPAVTDGVDVEFGMATKSGDERSSVETFWTIQISDHSFDIQTCQSHYDERVGSDIELTLYFQSEPGAFRSMERDLWRWVEDADAQINMEQMLVVYDDSEPDCCKRKRHAVPGERTSPADGESPEADEGQQAEGASATPRTEECFLPPPGLGLRIRPAFGTERLIMLEELGGTYYVVGYKPLEPGSEEKKPPPVSYQSLTEQIGQKSEFQREGHAVVWEEKIENQEAQRILKLLREVTVPPVCGTTMGLDGTTYELFWGDYFGGASFKWWEEPPAEWKSLAEVADALRNHMTLWGYD